MKLKGIVDEDWINYRTCSMYLIFPKCNFKCGKDKCQNKDLINEPDIEISISDIEDRYILNPLTHAVVCGGLEPFDSWNDLIHFIAHFRIYSEDPIIIYTGYTEKELADRIISLRDYENILIKFGRYIPGKDSHLDKELGVRLASPNQYAKWVSDIVTRRAAEQKKKVDYYED